MVTYIDLLQARFAYNARGEDNSYDCYGLCMEVSRRLGRELPEVATPRGLRSMEQRLQRAVERDGVWMPVSPSEGAWGIVSGHSINGERQQFGVREGAIAYFRVEGLLAHVGIIIAPDKFIHAWEKAGGVAVERLSAWEPRLVGVYEYRTDPC